MIAQFGELSWRFPWALFFALTPLVIYALRWSRRKRLLNYADAHLRAWALQDNRGGDTRRAWSDWLFWTLLAFALAGPRLPQIVNSSSAEQVLRRDVDIMVVLNVSASMERGAAALSPLARAKLEVADLLSRLQGERIGLIAFAGSAGLLLPPTYDYRLFSRFLDLADTSLVEPGPAEIGAALEVARQTLTRRATQRGAILLIDAAAPDAVRGERGADALRGAQRLKENNIELAILNVAPEDTQDVRALHDIAAMAGGKVARVDDGDREWRILYDNTIRAIPSAYIPPRDAGQWVELYPWLLLPAAWLLLVSTWQIRLRTVLLFALALLPASIRAETPQQAAHAAFQGHDFARAQLLYAAQAGYAARLGEGASAYRRKDYAHASAQFALALIESRSAAQRADALYNLANARFMQGRFDAALEAYRDAKRYRQNDGRIEHNLELAAARLASQRRARSEGVPGRRGAQVGGGPNEDITDRPAGMEDEKTDEPWMVLDDSAAAQAALRGELGGTKSGIRTRQGKAAFTDEARIAAKKIELLRDEPKALLGGLLRFEELHRRKASTEK